MIVFISISVSFSYFRIPLKREQAIVWNLESRVKRFRCKSLPCLCIAIIQILQRELLSLNNLYVILSYL